MGFLYLRSQDSNNLDLLMAVATHADDEGNNIQVPVTGSPPGTSC